MKDELRDILQKAAGKLKAAEILLELGAWDDAASRAYDARFHAISALHLSRNNTFSSHAQLIGRFNKDFVKTGTFPQDFTRTLTRLFEDRQTGDYDVIGAMTEEEARQDVEDARWIVSSIKAYLESGENIRSDL